MATSKIENTLSIIATDIRKIILKFVKVDADIAEIKKTLATLSSNNGTGYTGTIPSNFDTSAPGTGGDTRTTPPTSGNIQPTSPDSGTGSGTGTDAGTNTGGTGNTGTDTGGTSPTGPGTLDTGTEIPAVPPSETPTKYTPPTSPDYDSYLFTFQKDTVKPYIELQPTTPGDTMISTSVDGTYMEIQASFLNSGYIPTTWPKSNVSVTNEHYVTYNDNGADYITTKVSKSPRSVSNLGTFFYLRGTKAAMTKRNSNIATYLIPIRINQFQLTRTITTITQCVVINEASGKIEVGSPLLTPTDVSSPTASLNIIAKRKSTSVLDVFTFVNPHLNKLHVNGESMQDATRQFNIGKWYILGVSGKLVGEGLTLGSITNGNGSSVMDIGEGFEVIIGKELTSDEIKARTQLLLAAYPEYGNPAG